jgi:uncharacterized membrane protein
LEKLNKKNEFYHFCNGFLLGKKLSMTGKKKFLLFGLAFIYSMGVFAAQDQETPRILLFFGRFHPLLLHLPIGALLLTFFIEIVGRIRKNDFHIMVTNALAFSAFFTVLTAIMGYFLSLEGGYGKEVLDIHMYAGFAMSVLVILLYLSKRSSREKFRKAYIPVYIITLLLTTVTGHYGSILTHGDEFLTAYSPLDFGEDREIIMEVDSLYYYQHVITPILEDKCIQCHNPNKTKGELNLTTIPMIVKGGENGEVLMAGQADKSPMYTSLMHPIEEDEHMPPSGKPQLNRNEIWLIKHWIDTGADFKKQISQYEANDTLTKLLMDYLIFPKRRVDDASMAAVSRLTEDGFTIRRLVFGEPFLSATYSEPSQKISKKAMKNLEAISDQLVELNLQESKLTDDLSVELKKLTSLRTLRLDRTDISDNALENLKGLEELTVLNLFNTNISEQGLAELISAVDIKKVVFGTEGNEEDQLVSLQDKNTETYILQGIQEGFIVKTKLEKPVIVGNKSIFEKDIKIELKGNLKGEKLHYTLDGNDPDSTSALYTEPILLTESSLFKTRSYKEGWFASDIVKRDFEVVRYKAKEITVKYPPNKTYPGIEKLIDLEKGSTRFRDGKWNGYLDDLDATLDMGDEVEIKGLSVNCLEGVGSYIFFPLNMVVYAGNELDDMKPVARKNLPPCDRKRSVKIENFKLEFEPIKARYIRVYMKNMKRLPKWHEAAGAEAYLFVDEIMVL